MTTFDSVLNWLIPTLLILIVIGFAWTKFIQPYVAPLFQKIINYFKGKSEEEGQHKVKEITYE
jgi:transposase